MILLQIILYLALYTGMVAFAVRGAAVVGLLAVMLVMMF